MQKNLLAKVVWSSYMQISFNYFSSVVGFGDCSAFCTIEEFITKRHWTTHTTITSFFFINIISCINYLFFSTYMCWYTTILFWRIFCVIFSLFGGSIKICFDANAAYIQYFAAQNRFAYKRIGIYTHKAHCIWSLYLI